MEKVSFIEMKSVQSVQSQSVLLAGKYQGHLQFPLGKSEYLR